MNNNHNSINTMNKKLLIVDDEAHIRMLIEQTLEDLEDEGVRCFLAENGRTGIRNYQAEKPQLVFLDVMMPKMNGMEVCQTVKKELELKECLYHFTYCKRPGSRPAKRPGSGCRSIYDKTF